MRYRCTELAGRRPEGEIKAVLEKNKIKNNALFEIQNSEGRAEIEENRSIHRDRWSIFKFVSAILFFFVRNKWCCFSKVTYSIPGCVTRQNIVAYIYVFDEKVQSSRHRPVTTGDPISRLHRKCASTLSNESRAQLSGSQLDADRHVYLSLWSEKLFFSLCPYPIHVGSHLVHGFCRIKFKKRCR